MSTHVQWFQPFLHFFFIILYNWPNKPPAPQVLNNGCKALYSKIKERMGLYVAFNSLGHIATRVWMRRDFSYPLIKIYFEQLSDSVRVLRPHCRNFKANNFQHYR